VPANSSIEDQFLKKLTDLTEANLTNEQFGVSELAREMNMSRSNLHRKVISITKTSVSQFIRQYRLKRAMEMLQQTALTVSEVAYNVGFGSVTYFTKCFHDYFGFPPGEVGKRNLEEPGFGEQAIDIRLVKNRKRFKIVLLMTTLFVIISVTILYLVFNPFSSGKNKLEKSIAVLPFIDDSPEEGNTYIINGLREEILDKLEKISDLKVKSRTAAEKYKDSKLSIREIGRNLKVNYILEGSGQKIQDRIKLRLQLIEVQSGNHVWSKPYVEDVNDDRIFELQENVALSVADELKAIITPEEKKMVSISNTQNKTALSLYWQGMNYYNIFYKEHQKSQLLHAKTLFRKALECDSIYSMVIYKLACVLLDESTFGETKIKRDSAVFLVNKAIMLNPLFSEAYSLKGFLFQKDEKVAKEAFNMAIRTGPNKPQGYHHLGNYCCNTGEYANTIKYSLKSLEVNNEPFDYEWTLINLNVALSSNEFFDLAAKYRTEYMVQHNNQMINSNMQQFEAILKREYAESIQYGLHAYKSDSTDLTTLDYLGQACLFLNNFEKAMYYYKKYFEVLKLQPYQIDFPSDYDFLYQNNKHSNSIGHDIFPLLHATYLYGITQNKKIFNTYKKALFDNLENHIKCNTLWAQTNLCFFEIGCFYASINENERAIENLKKLTKGKVNPVWLVNYLKDNPMLVSLRNNNEFIEILKKLETNYQKEHQKSENILIENGLEPS
jgi:TolB-like protein/AraC-like DNA-binding protein